MEVIIETRSVYGKTAHYPTNDAAKLFAELLGQKTLTERDLLLIKKLGYRLNLNYPSLPSNLLTI